MARKASHAKQAPAAPASTPTPAPAGLGPVPTLPVTDTTTGARATRDVLAGVLGVPPERLHVDEGAWLHLMQEGVIAAVHISRWRPEAPLVYADLGLPTPGAGPTADGLGALVEEALQEAPPEPEDAALAARLSAGATTNAERGMRNPELPTAPAPPAPAAAPAPPDPATPAAPADSAIRTPHSALTGDVLRLGHKLLVPPALARQLEAAESKLRKTLSRLALRTFWGYWVPASRFQEWMAAYTKLQAEFYDLRDRLVREYATWRVAVAGEYARHAFGVWCRRTGADPTTLTSEQRAEASAYTRAAVLGLLRAIPSRASIYARFACTLELRYIPLPSLLAADRAREAAIAGAAADARALRAERLAMERAVLAQAQQQKTELVEGFLRDLVVQLRGEVYAIARDVLAALDRSGRTRAGTPVLLRQNTEQVQGLIRTIRELNILGDRDVDAMAARLEALVSATPAPGREIDVSVLQSTLREIGVLTRATLVELGESPASARDLGIPDSPGAPRLRAAREALDLDGTLAALLEAPARTRGTRGLEQQDAPAEAAQPTPAEAGAPTPTE